ncbi:MAG TPA: YceI family protein [Thermoanaerobaculia bacterium]|nr:YceI family protein [Thermoanaerobaculia bacterium]
MKRTLTILTLALAAAFAASAERFAATNGSLVRIEGTSTLHAWSMEGSTIQGQITVADAPNAVVTIPVTSIKSEHAKMDKLMAEALKAKTNPEIRFELTGATPVKPSGETFNVKTQGRLTIAGVTRDVTLDVKGARNANGGYTLTGEAPIKMSAFGITPPTAMLNTIKTGDDVKVTFRWVVQPTK